MAYFSYSGVNSQGGKIKGVIETDSQDSVVMDLVDKGITPIQIKAVGSGKDISGIFSEKLAKNRPNLDDVILVCRQLYSLNKAGIPMLRALNTLLKTQKKPAMIEAIQKVISGLESGQSLSTAMSHSPQVFSPIIVNMVHVGENTGRLDKVFKQLSEYLEQEKSTAKQLKQTMRYPLFVISFIVGAIIIVNYKVIPNFLNIFSKLGADLPMPTQILLGTSHLFVNYWWVMLMIVVAMYGTSKYYLSTEIGRIQWDRTKLTLPGIGELLERVALTRFSRVFAMMIKEGIPILNALNVVAGVVGNAHVKQSVHAMVGRISRGEGLTQAAIKSELFTPIVIQMLAVGEASGELDQLLDEVADYYEREFDYDLKQFSDWVEPMLLIVLSVLVLGLILGVYMPLWDLGVVATKGH